MAKFKVGDKITMRSDAAYFPGETVEIKSVDKHDTHMTYYGTNGSRECWVRTKGIKEAEPYRPITPKVGERYRVVKHVIGHAEPGFITTMTRQRDKIYFFKDTSGVDMPYRKEHLTTEYLELVEEPKMTAQAMMYGGCVLKNMGHGKIVPVDLHAYRIGESPIEESINKPSLTQNIMSFIKRATMSKEDKTLTKAGFLDSCGDLTSKGRDALTSILFTEKKTSLVALAQEVIDEQKED